MTTEMIGWGAALEQGDPDHIILFISGYGREGSQQFHFSGYAKQFSQTKLFLRDHANCMYAQGIQGVTDDEEENVAFLRYLIDKIGASRVSIVSGSMATHPAIIWGHKLKVNDIHLIGPMADINLCLKQDRVYQPAFEGPRAFVEGLVAENYPHLDLRPFMQEHADAVDCVDIYYGQADKIDLDQAATIADLPQVRSTIYHTGDHFRVPMFVQRRDPDMTNRINAPTVDRPADLRKAGKTEDIELGYAVVRLV